MLKKHIVTIPLASLFLVLLLMPVYAGTEDNSYPSLQIDPEKLSELRSIDDQNLNPDFLNLDLKGEFELKTYPSQIALTKVLTPLKRDDEDYAKEVIANNRKFHQNILNNLHLVYSPVYANLISEDVTLFAGEEIPVDLFPEAKSLKFDKGNKKYNCNNRRFNPEFCITDKDLENIFQNNARMISKYKNVINTYPGLKGKFILQGEPIIQINEFFSHYWPYMTRNAQGEAALKEALKHYDFWQKSLSYPRERTEAAVIKILRGIAFAGLSDILTERPDLIPEFKDEIIQTLSHPVFGNKGWNIEGTNKENLEIIYTYVKAYEAQTKTSHSFAYRPNATRNQMVEYYDHVQSFHTMSVPQLIRMKNNDETQKWHDNLLKTEPVLDNYMGKLFLATLPINYHLTLNEYDQANSRRALLLFVMAHSEDIAADDMATFLTKAPEDLYNAVTNKPMTWDTERSAIVSINTDGCRDLLYYKKTDQDKDKPLTVCPE